MKNMILRILLALKPHMVKACSRCGSTAGFWVMRNGAQSVRRPWCLSCVSEPEFDPSLYRVVHFDGIQL